MIFITTYKIKPFLSNEETKKLMEVFAKAGAGPGVVIAETDDVVSAYRNIQNYTQWVEYDTKVMLTIEDAVPQIMDALS